MTNNRVTQEEISTLMNSAETQEHTFWDKELIVSYKFPCGFTISGRGACVDPANFNLEIGRQVARRDAESQLWQLEGYRKQLEMAAAIERKTKSEIVKVNSQNPIADADAIKIDLSKYAEVDHDK